nr:hypothetical protein [Pandoravirus massiliensis]
MGARVSLSLFLCRPFLVNGERPDLDGDIYIYIYCAPQCFFFLKPSKETAPTSCVLHWQCGARTRAEASGRGGKKSAVPFRPKRAGERTPCWATLSLFFSLCARKGRCRSRQLLAPSGNSAPQVCRIRTVCAGCRVQRARRPERGRRREGALKGSGTRQRARESVHARRPTDRPRIPSSAKTPTTRTTNGSGSSNKQRRVKQTRERKGATPPIHRRQSRNREIERHETKQTSH